MTDKEVLYHYRLKQAEETLSDAQKMLREGCSPMSVINRSYYSMFYAILALFLRMKININTSKHAGIISTFDKEFVHLGKIDKSYSQMLHRGFEARQEGDYKELVEFSAKEAERFVDSAGNFLEGIKKIVDKS